MKTNYFQTMVAVLAVTGLTFSGASALAQGSPAANPAQPATVGAPAPQLTYGAAEIVKLAQAKVGDDTIITFINHSADGYGLNADQIIYLRQRGVSDAVLTAMLQHPGAQVAAAMPTATAPVASTAYAEQGSTATVAPSVSYVQAVPTTTYYYSQPSYLACAWFPPVSLSFAWGGGWRGGCWHH